MNRVRNKRKEETDKNFIDKYRPLAPAQQNSNYSSLVSSSTSTTAGFTGRPVVSLSIAAAC